MLKAGCESSDALHGAFPVGCQAETRLGLDGISYSHAQFCAYYGKIGGDTFWLQTGERMLDVAQEAPAHFLDRDHRTQGAWRALDGELYSFDQFTQFYGLTLGPQYWTRALRSSLQ